MRRPIITHSCPDVGEEEIEALSACVRSLQLKGGERVQALERQVAADLGFAGAIATTTGSHAIHLALRAVFDKKKAAIGLPSYLCRSVYDAICLAGCKPVVFDIDPETLSLNWEMIKSKTLDAIIVPHVFGIRAKVEDFTDRGILVIEDCAQRIAPFETSQKEPKGAIRILSFEATKLVTSGEGGMLLCDDMTLLDRAKKLRDAAYDFAEPALGLPMTDLQAAMAGIQWLRYSSFVDKRVQLARYYMDKIEPKFPQAIFPAMRADDTYHFRFILTVENPEGMMESAAEQGIIIRRPISPATLHQLFQLTEAYPCTDYAFSHLVSLPLYPRLTWVEAGAVADFVCSFLQTELP